MRNLFGACLLLLILGTVCVEKDYSFFVKNIAAKMQTAPYKHSAYDLLAYITDTYGTRMWGSNSLELVINDLKARAVNESFDNVRLEPVSNFTKWVRGKESLTMIAPRPTPSKLDVIGLGGTVAGSITADAIVVKSFAQLDSLRAKIPGKIVVYNNPWIDYHSSGQYRVKGGSIAAKYGAKAMLVRSVASESISSVHTGYMEYDPMYPKIPCAAITVEDAQMLNRIQDRGQVIKLSLILENQFISNASSNNLVFQIQGSAYPDQIVLAGGHIDTWDTGSQTGANDDGGGFVTVFEAFKLLKRLDYRPKRTLRFIAWSGEESGSDRDGAAQYVKLHANEVSKHIAAFESDFGSTKLKGFGHNGVGGSIVKEILSKYLSILGSGNYSDYGYNADTEPLYDLGVPMFNNFIEDNASHDFYFKYHHSAGDTMSIMDPDDMDSNVQGIAAFLFIIADYENTVRSVPYMLRKSE